MQCTSWAGDGSHRTPMMTRANQTPAIDSVRIDVGGRRAPAAAAATAPAATTPRPPRTRRPAGCRPARRRPRRAEDDAPLRTSPRPPATAAPASGGRRVERVGQQLAAAADRAERRRQTTAGTDASRPVDESRVRRCDAGRSDEVRAAPGVTHGPVPGSPARAAPGSAGGQRQRGRGRPARAAPGTGTPSASIASRAPVSRSTTVATPTTVAPASRAARDRGEHRRAGGRGVLHHQHPAAGDVRALDQPLHAVLLGLLAHHERVERRGVRVGGPLGRRGVQHRVGHRVGAQGQPADRRVLPVRRSAPAAAARSAARPGAPGSPGAGRRSSRPRRRRTA